MPKLAVAPDPPGHRPESHAVPISSLLFPHFLFALCYNRANRQFARNQLDGPAQGKIMIWTPLAYLDPGSGSLFLQLLLGGIAGVAVLGKLLWQRILSALGIRSGSPQRNAASLQKTDRKQK